MNEDVREGQVSDLVTRAATAPMDALGAAAAPSGTQLASPPHIVTPRTTPKSQPTGLGTVRRSRSAVGIIFALHGVTAGSYAGRLPWLENHLHASPGAMGAAMIAQGVGALAAAPATGIVTRRLGAKSGMRCLIIVWTGSLAVPAFMPDLGLLAMVLFGFGAAAGCADVAMNAHAVRVERRAGRSILSGLHGLWAVGMIVGSAVGGFCAAVGVNAPVQFLVTAIVLMATAAVTCAFLPVDDPSATRMDVPRYALPNRAVLMIGVVAFCAVFAEGASDNWCAIYLIRVTHSSAAIGAYCLTGFSVAMAAGRLSGDVVVRHFGASATARAGGSLAVVAALLIVAARDPAWALAGFGALGLGIATVVPLAIAAAGRTRGDAGAAVAGMTTIVYGGGLLAGPVVGALGSAVSLPFAFIVVALAAAGISLGSAALGARGHHQSGR